MVENTLSVVFSSDKRAITASQDIVLQVLSATGHDCVSSPSGDGTDVDRPYAHLLLQTVKGAYLKGRYLFHVSHTPPLLQDVACKITV